MKKILTWPKIITLTAELHHKGNLGSYNEQILCVLRNKIKYISKRHMTSLHQCFRYIFYKLKTIKLV